jgi:hypothetical protein
VVLVENGRYKGFGNLDADHDLNNLEAIKNQLSSAYDDQDMSNLIHAYVSKHEEQVHYIY